MGDVDWSKAPAGDAAAGGKTFKVLFWYLCLSWIQMTDLAQESLSDQEKWASRLSCKAFM
jgi:hypothetical protein